MGRKETVGTLLLTSVTLHIIYLTDIEVCSSGMVTWFVLS